MFMEKVKFDNSFENYQIIDNFLEQGTFERFVEIFSTPHFPWYFNDGIAKKQLDGNYELDNYYFTHHIYKNDMSQSDFFNMFNVFYEKLNIFSLLRIQLNLYTRTANKIDHDWHIDYSQEKEKKWTTCVYYLNSNDGTTSLIQNDKEVYVESVANRILIFSGNMLHRSSTCTNSKTRMVANINYV